jgi:hypothetical protein
MLTICASSSWEMTLNVSLEFSFDNCENGNEYGGMKGKLIVRKYITNCETSR